MNDLSSEAGLFRRELRDVRTVTQNTDIRLRRLLEAALPVQRPGGLTARHAFCAVRGFTEKRGAEHVARQLFGTDRELSQLIELKTATGPAMTSSAPWAGELIGTVVQDIADNLLPASVLSQLRELSGNPYLFVDGAVTKVPAHTPAPNGSFVGEGLAIPVVKLLLASASLPAKKCASITAFSRELANGSPVNVEIAFRTLLQQDLGLAVDAILLDAVPRRRCGLPACSPA